MPWTTLHLRVLTPMFTADSPDSGPATVRVPSVRGALRFWLRAVIAGRQGLVGRDDLAALWAAEEAVLGSTRVPSRIGLRIRKQPDSCTETHPSWAFDLDHRGFDGAQYLLGQGLWSNKKNETGLTRSYVPESAELDLDVRFSGDPHVDARFMLALWTWLTYGGLGARTRRGFGQLGCVGVSGDLPGGWTQKTLERPSGRNTWTKLGKLVFPPVAPWAEPAAWTGVPTGSAADEAEHPALDRRWWKLEVVGWRDSVPDPQRSHEVDDEPARSLGIAFHRAGVKWRLFRAGRGAAVDDDGLPFQGTRSPEWTGVVHGPGTDYPVGALGLPVNYYSRSTGTTYKAAVTPRTPGPDPEELRRASPVWLRPVPLHDGTWVLVTFYFAARLLPPDAVLELRPSRGRAETLTAPDRTACDRIWRAWLGGADRPTP